MVHKNLDPRFNLLAEKGYLTIGGPCLNESLGTHRLCKQPKKFLLKRNNNLSDSNDY